MTLEERLKEIEARGYAQEATCTCGTDIPALLRMLRLAIEQRNTAYVCSWDKDLGNMIADDDAELLKAGEG